MPEADQGDEQLIYFRARVELGAALARLPPPRDAVALLEQIHHGLLAVRALRTALGYLDQYYTRKSYRAPLAEHLSEEVFCHYDDLAAVLLDASAALPRGTMWARPLLVVCARRGLRSPALHLPSDTLRCIATFVPAPKRLSGAAHAARARAALPHPPNAAAAIAEAPALRGALRSPPPQWVASLFPAGVL